MTVTDNQILTAIAEMTTQKGYSPTFRELGDRIGLSSTSSVFRRCNKLAASGLLEPGGTPKARSVRLTAAGAARVPGGQTPAIATSIRVQQVPVLRSSASLMRYLEMPTHRERVTPAQSLAGQNVQVLPVAEIAKAERGSHER